MESPENAEFVHVWEPPVTDDAPVLLTLHGTGGDERDLLALGRVLVPGAGLLSPRGNVIEGDGIPRFFRRIPTDTPGPYPFTFDDAEVAERAADLANWVADVRADYDVADRRLLVTGFSNGANMAAAMVMFQPGLFDAAVLFAPMPVLSSPPEGDLHGAAVWLGGGRRDPIATPGQVEQLAGQLEERGADVTTDLFMAGHEVTREAIEAAHAWLKSQ